MNSTYYLRYASECDRFIQGVRWDCLHTVARLLLLQNPRFFLAFTKVAIKGTEHDTAETEAILKCLDPTASADYLKEAQQSYEKYCSNCFAETGQSASQHDLGRTLLDVLREVRAEVSIQGGVL